MTFSDFFKKSRGIPEKKKIEHPVVPSERKGPSSVSFHFRNSLNDLMNKITASSPHFIRCIKPNIHKSPGKFTRDYVALQLTYSGISETVKIRQVGYPFRPTFQEFLERFPAVKLCYFPSDTPTDGYVYRHSLNKLKIEDFKVGKTKLFFRFDHVEQLEELSRNLETKVLLVQKVVRGFLARQKFAKLLQVKHQQEKQRLYIEDVANQCLPVLQHDHDSQRHDVMIRQGPEEVWQLQDMEDRKRNEDVRRSLDQLDEVLSAYDDVSPLDENRLSLLESDTTRSSAAVEESDVETPYDIQLVDTQNDHLKDYGTSGQVITGVTLKNSQTENVAINSTETFPVSDSNSSLGASEGAESKGAVNIPRDKDVTLSISKEPDSVKGEDEVFYPELGGYVTPREGSIRTKIPPPSPAEAATVVANIFPCDRKSFPPPSDSEDMLPPPPPMEDFPPPPPELTDHFPLPPPPQEDWEGIPENGMPRQRSQPQTLTIQGGKKPPAPPKRSPSTRLSSASLSDVPSSPSSQSSRPGSRQLDKSASPSPDSTMESRSHSRSSSESYDRLSIGSHGERHSITGMYDMPNVQHVQGLRPSASLQRSMSQNSHERTAVPQHGCSHSLSDVGDHERRRGSYPTYPKGGVVPPPPRFTNGGNGTYDEINGLSNYQRHLDRNNDHYNVSTKDDPDYGVAWKSSRPPPLQMDNSGRPPACPPAASSNGRVAQTGQRWTAPDMSPPPSFTPPPPPAKKSPKTPQSPVLSYRTPQSPRTSRGTDHSVEKCSPTFSRRNNGSPVSSRTNRFNNAHGVADTQASHVSSSQMPPRTHTPPTDGPVIQHNIKPSMLKSPAHQQYTSGSNAQNQKQVSPPTVQNIQPKVPPPTAAKPEIVHQPVSDSVTIQPNLKPSMLRSAVPPQPPTPENVIEKPSKVRPSMFRSSSQSSPPPPPHPVEKKKASPPPEPAAKPRNNSITQEHLIRPSAVKSSPPPPMPPVVPKPVEAAPPPPPPPPGVPQVPAPPMFRAAAPQTKHKVSKPVQPPVAPRKITPSGMDLTEITNVQLKKRPTSDEREKVPPSVEDPHNDMLNQIRGGLKLKRSVGSTIPEIHGGSIEADDSEMNHMCDIDDEPLPPPPPIDEAFEEECRQYKEFLRREELKSSSCGSNNMPGSRMGKSQENSNSDVIDCTQIPGYQSVPESCPPWKIALIERKNKEAIDKFNEERAEQERENAKWQNIPQWKKDLMLKKEQQKKTEMAPAEEERRRMEEEEARLGAMPAWKKNILMKKRQDSN